MKVMTTRARENGAYVSVDGVTTYYEVAGNGDAVVWLHGGLCTAETLDGVVGGLAGSYRVFVPERVGHGRTPDRPGPYSYEDQAAHTIAFIEALGLASVRLAGWSDGALVGLLVALRRPRLVSHLVFVDKCLTLDSVPIELRIAATEDLERAVPPSLLNAYRAVSPDGAEHLPIVLAKLQRLWTSPTGVELSDLANLRTPTLLVAADGGMVSLDALAEIHRALPTAQVAVVPGTTHALPLEKPDAIAQLCREFFAA